MSAQGHVDLASYFDSPGVFALALLGALSLAPAVALASAVCGWWRGNRQVARLLKYARPCDLFGIRCLVVEGDETALFTARCLNPVIVVSTGAMRQLTAQQMSAGLLHDLAHQRRRDVLWRALLVAVGRAFSFVPGTRKMVAAATLRSECAADDEAVRGGAQRGALFEAIVSAATSPALTAAGLSDSTVAFRLQRHATPAIPGSPGIGLTLRLALVGLLPLGGHALLFAGLACTDHF